MLKYLDTIPINSDLIERSQLSVRDNSIYLKHLRFSHKCLDTLSRVSNLQNFLKKNALGQEALPYLIESYILRLLYTNSITNPSRTYRSPHYIKRIEVLGYLKPEIPDHYLQEIALSNLEVWGGLYGMPSFCLHLQSDTRHYLTTSQIADKVCQYYLSRLSLNKDWDWDIDYLDDRAEIDETLYNLSHYIISDSPPIRDCYLIYRFLSDFIPDSISFYEENYDSAEDIYLKDICKVLISLGMDKNKEKFYYQYVHQSLSPVWDELFPTLIDLRKRAPSLTESVHPLTKSFIDRISITTANNLYATSSNSLLSYLTPPGGLNLYLMVLAIALLNRALILSYEEDLQRVNNLLYYSSLCLRKSNLGHIQKIGNNLLFLSRRTATKATDLLS